MATTMCMWRKDPWPHPPQFRWDDDFGIDRHFVGVFAELLSFWVLRTDTDPKYRRNERANGRVSGLSAVLLTS
jgi:hypothetical protein